ncbi:MAG: hypothetical protein ABSG17_24310 [Spirochaetia bacterium]|jgi:hypothetical protein
MTKSKTAEAFIKEMVAAGWNVEKDAQGSAFFSYNIPLSIRKDMANASKMSAFVGDLTPKGGVYRLKKTTPKGKIPDRMKKKASVSRKG